MKAGRTLLAVAYFLACTSVHYESPRLAGREPGSETIAVLPFEMVLTGKAPVHLGPSDIERIEEAESLAFQASLYDQLLDQSSVGRRRPILVRIQPIETTNGLLAERGLSIRQSWSASSQELAAVLGVDGVIRTRVEKTRYLSDLESWGTEVGLEIVAEATEREVAWVIPPGLTRTHDVLADSALVSGEDGDVLWKVAVERAADWRRPANDVVVGITRKLSKKFPYRG
jgi:hypothetical protein